MWAVTIDRLAPNSRSPRSLRASLSLTGLPTPPAKVPLHNSTPHHENDSSLEEPRATRGLLAHVSCRQAPVPRRLPAMYAWLRRAAAPWLRLLGKRRHL